MGVVQPPRRRTRERILETALRMFNELGEPTVTTQAISDALGISSGNLYYHFHHKEEIVACLFEDFERDMAGTMDAPLQHVPTVEDVAVYLRGIFQTIWRHRFLYRDVNELLSRNRTLELRFRSVLERQERTAVQICAGQVQAGFMRATPQEIATLAINMVVIATWWMSYEFARNPRLSLDEQAMARGVFQVMACAAPYLTGKARTLFDELASQDEKTKGITT